MQGHSVACGPVVDRMKLCNGLEKTNMWEVMATSKNGKVQTKIVSRFDNGMHLASRAIQRGRTVTVKPIYFDFYVVDDEGEFVKVQTRITAQEAANNAVYWAKMDQQSGCLLWPHGLATPSYWNVADKSELGISSDIETINHTGE
jgi:hypothetical protein